MRFEKVVCDRCKSEINITEDACERKIWLSGKGREGGLDLCDECYNEMFKWFTRFHMVDDEVPDNEDNYFPNICKTCRYNAEHRCRTVSGTPAEQICKVCNRGTHYQKFIVYDDCP